MGKKVENSTWLSEFRLANYKSVVELKGEFKPGLNILIGKNGAGKTNILSFLSKTSNARAHFHSLEQAELNFKHERSSQPLVIKRSRTQIGDESGNDFPIDFCLVPQAYDQYTPGLVAPLDFDTADTSKAYINLIQGNHPSFIQKRLAPFIIQTALNTRESQGIEQIREAFLHNLSGLIEKLEVVSDYCPVEAIRISHDLRFQEGSLESSVKVKGELFDFQVGNRWLDFSQLSDGTRRIFLIIAEMELADSRFFRKSDGNLPEGVKETIFLIEEPELGVHPHQLYQLMSYIKDQSKHSQVILSTHSPQVLNFLSPNELDRLYITQFSPKDGTKISQLSEEEIQDAQEYMENEELFLSDYWVHSNLEPDF